MESVNVGENDVVENVIELYDISFSFLAMHTSEMENLFDDTIGYFSPILLAAFDLNAQKVHQQCDQFGQFRGLWATF